MKEQVDPGTPGYEACSSYRFPSQALWRVLRANFWAQNWRTEGREEAAAKKETVRGEGKKKEEAEHKKSACVLFDGVINKAEGHSYWGSLLHSEPTVNFITFKTAESVCNAGSFPLVIEYF